MAAIDGWLEGFLHGSTALWAVLLIGLLLGLRHASDPDHLAAVSTLIASEKEGGGWRKAGSMGFAWGLGHGTSLVLIGLPFVLLERYMPGQQAAETLVGGIIIFLAVRLLVRWRRGHFHAHVHSHDGGEAYRHVLLGMNAHINYELPLSLLGVIDDAEFADPEVVAKRNRNHTHIDTVLLGRVGAEDEAITTAHGGKSAYERLKAPLEWRATGHFLREARATVWANARLMAAARARGDAAALERLRAELARRAADKLDELARAPEVLLHLWIKGFGVRLDQP